MHVVFAGQSHLQGGSLLDVGEQDLGSDLTSAGPPTEGDGCSLPHRVSEDGCIAAALASLVEVALITNHSVSERTNRLEISWIS
jgi:hypothetical protein